MDFKKHLSPINRAIENNQANNAVSLKAPLYERKRDWQQIITYLLAFFIPVIIMLIVYVCIGIYPFGDKTLLTIDLYHQYIDFFSYFRESISSMSLSNFLYSFSKSIGGNMLGLFAYYLASPLNLVFLFFNHETLSEGVLVLTLLKIGFCGLTFSFMYKQIFKSKDWFSLIFSTCYALMAYNLVFQQNIMWLDGVIWLPIIALGIHSLVKSNKFLLYSFSLCMALLSNYYIGYMLCIFSVIFFIYLMVVNSKRNLSKNEFLKKIGYFLLGSLLAGGLAAALLIPTFLSLQGGKATFDIERFTLTANFDFTQFLQKLFIGEIDIDLLHQGKDTTLPDVFSGTVITVLSFLYFANKRITFKEKLASIFVVLLMLMSFHIKALDLIWHGMSTPVGFLYRNSFIFSFFAIYMGCRSFQNLNGITKGNMLSCLGIFVGIAIIVNSFSLETLTAFEIYLTILFFIIYIIILNTILLGKKSAYLIVAFMMIVAVEFEINGCLTLEEMSHVSRKTYVEAVQSLKKANARVKAIDNGIYRIDKTYFRSRNDGMMLAYNTLTHSSSTADFNLVAFLNKLGFRNESNIGNSYDFGSTLPATSLLNIKYILDKNGIQMPYFVSEGFSDNTQIYKNPYALPLMFKANRNVLKTQDSYDIFLLQNDLYSNMSGSGEVLTEIRNINIKLNNLTKTINSDSGSLESGNYSKNDKTQEASIEYTFTAINNEEIYAHFPTEPISESTVDVVVNGKKIREHFDSDHLTYYDILNLGKFNKGDTVNLKFELHGDETNFDAAHFYALNLENFIDAHKTLTSEPMNIELISQNHIKATVNNITDSQLVFTSIPYDKGWKIYVDGKKVKSEKVLNTLMAFETGMGTHSIEMKYTPPGLVVGVLVSAISLTVFLFFLWDNIKNQ